MPPRTIAQLVLSPEEQELQTKRSAAAVAKANHAADKAAPANSVTALRDIVRHLLDRVDALEAERERDKAELARLRGG
jgi:hypothetical protein